MLKPIILISSCAKDQSVEVGNNQAIRDTWGRTAVIPYKFFLGDFGYSGGDIVDLDCPDNYFSLPWKTKLSLEWALREGYTHFFRAFTDTYIDTFRLSKSDFERYSYVGNPCGFWQTGFMHGGPGYWLDQEAAQLVVNQDCRKQRLEDYWVGRVVARHGLNVQNDFRYSMGTSYGRREAQISCKNDIISEHLSSRSGKYDKSMMYDAHRRRFPVLDIPSTPR